jgi:glycosyltransferase involved in cell wall biosynthesis
MAVNVRIRTKNLAVVSPYLAENWRKQMFWKKQISILPNFTSVELLQGKNMLPMDKKTVLCISDSSRLKNVKTLVKAWKDVRAIYPTANLKLVGNGLGMGQEIHQWAKLNRLSDGIEWIGYIDHSLIVQELSQANILCHPSLEESHSLVLVEALARGLPVIGGKHSGAVPWTIGNSGLLVDVKSNSEIANAIVELLLYPELRSRMSELAQKRSSELFSDEEILSKHMQAYRKIL